MKSLFLISFITVCLFANAQISGCTDPLANNYNTEATINDGSCTYGTSTVSAAVTHELPVIMEETSGLIYWNNKIWTHNDDADINLYSFSFDNVEDYNTYELTGTQNIDQEEISQDSNYIYIGDFGNNVSGNRTNLKILRVEKQSLLDGTPIIDTIHFTYSNQTNFEATEANKTDFDCESFIVSTDSIYLFTKQWLSQKTAVYSLSKYPGEHIANYKNDFNVAGLITGAVYNRAKRYVVLCGYSSTVQPFFYLLYDFNGNDFFSGNKRKISFSHSFHQVEGITTNNGLTFYASNEKLVKFITIPQKIHEVDLSTYLSTYISSITPDVNAPVISSTHNDVDLYANNNCEVILPDYRTDVFASDDITTEDNLIIVQYPHPGTYISSDNNQISLRVYDEYDNFDEVFFNVNIIDTISPTITVEDTNIYIEAAENCSAAIPDFLENLDIYDNCTANENLVLTQTPEPGTLCIGSENEVLLTLTDESDNETQIALNIIITDTTPPTINIPEINPIILDENCSAVIPDFIEISEISDNCTSNENLVLTQTPEPGTLCSGSENEVLLTLTDESNNETQIILNISVIDTTPPTINCPVINPITIENDELYYTVNETEFDPDNYSDNCSIASITNDYNSNSSLSNAEFNIGTTSVVWTATDESGNTNTCTYNIIINSTDIDTENISGLSIYPNPAKDIIIIKDENLIVNKLILTDINGKSIPILAKKENMNYSFDISELSAGIYFINIETKDKINLKYKIIKQ
ncbi:MAG: HYR domain-containing protein [Bacteroidales bacterium]|nr:HYR domain-containing protein [Bacteroidales bacterium]